jgi:hypothetical protein
MSMEQLKYNLPSKIQPTQRDAVLVGVTASGNCEVLLEWTFKLLRAVLAPFGKPYWPISQSEKMQAV